MDKKAVRSPVTKGAAKVPVVMQMEALECGAACLTMILAYYGKWVPLEQVRSDCGVSRDGSKASKILKAARSYGLEADGYRAEKIETVRDNAKFPCIIHWNYNHFVVLDGIKGNKAYLNDPARGNVVVTLEELDKSFTGIVMMFEPTGKFEPGGKPKGVFEYAKQHLKGTKTAVLFVVLTTLITTLIGIVNPLFSRVFYDRLLTGQNPEWLVPFMTALIIMSLVQLTASWINTVSSLKINGKMSVVGSMTFMWHIMHLPMEFFSQRMAGDVLSRKDSNANIARSIVNTVAPLFLNTCLMIFYLVVMLGYSIPLTMIGIGSIVVNMLVSNAISKKRLNISRSQMRDGGKLAGTTVSGIEMIETIKACGAENGFFEKWSGYQASVNTASYNSIRTDLYLGTIPEIVSSLANIAVLVSGVFLVINGQFTIGMVMAFQSYLGAFTGPAHSIIAARSTIQQMKAEMERVEDVMGYKEDVSENSEEGEDDDYEKLSGEFELKNVSFGYSKLDKPLITDFSIKVEQGQRIALVGSSGCGKSTLSKLISGLYRPWSGEILFDGKPISDINKNVFRSSVAVVDQEITLFEDTISSNIKMFDSTIEDFEMIMAARDAQIHDDIMHRTGGYKYSLKEGGGDLSGGQRQRMEIARVLAQDPKIIILDEATSALDAKTEYDVVNAIRERGITCVVVAHRLSTIRDCDEILVLDKGVVVERGTHDELFAKGGYYTKLVTNE